MTEMVFAAGVFMIGAALCAYVALIAINWVYETFRQEGDDE